MAKIGRPGLSDDQRRRVWELWKQGHTFSEIARLVDRPPGSIFPFFNLGEEFTIRNLPPGLVL